MTTQNNSYLPYEYIVVISLYICLLTIAASVATEKIRDICYN